MQAKRGFHSVLSLAEAIESGAIGLALSLSGTYLFSRRKGAEALDLDWQCRTDRAQADCNQAMADLTKKLGEHSTTIENQGKHIASLATALEQERKPKRTAAEEHRRAAAKTALERVGEHGESVLRHLMTHGVLSFGFYGPNPPSGITGEQFRSILNFCSEENLVTREYAAGAEGKISYTIAPAMRAVLEELLYPPAES